MTYLLVWIVLGIMTSIVIQLIVESENVNPLTWLVITVAWPLIILSIIITSVRNEAIKEKE